jgi:hypothetical protein
VYHASRNTTSVHSNISIFPGVAHPEELSSNSLLCVHFQEHTQFLPAVLMLCQQSTGKAAAVAAAGIGRSTRPAGFSDHNAAWLKPAKKQQQQEEESDIELDDIEQDSDTADTDDGEQQPPNKRWKQQSGAAAAAGMVSAMDLAAH